MYDWQNDALILKLRVLSRASKNEIVGAQGNQLKIRIMASPANGKANLGLIVYLADIFGVANSRISLLSVESGRKKRLRIHSPNIFPPAQKNNQSSL